ncbi:hypothetical protein VHEMI10260 [[Torrubiella] hemipterigena]|uniref:Uncharacterized protein n=1 Tax=[Torrubiella] hemipterigena TaxID=1531966 RepID=A0A0A1TRL1_9HYPO|nr:hypothetical protein VHEMI10260 [[Torrubiella] hemipterigena]
MKESLETYITQRIHQDVLSRQWHHIIISGTIQRSAPATISSWERTDRPFNYRRPTATIEDDSTITLHCLPSASCVQHYASVISTYLSLTGGNPAIVQVKIPRDDTLANIFLASNLPQIEKSDVFIIGDVDLLRGLSAGVSWGNQSEDELFAWHRYTSRNGNIATLLGCRESIWGEASGALSRLVHKIADAQCIIYVGKVGSLHPGPTPNTTIASGSSAILDGKLITWDSPLEQAIEGFERVTVGSQITVSSPLCETNDWLETWKEKCMWVDCESGHIARVANETRMDFGYLHIVSDNLSCESRDNLSNEHFDDVGSKREGVL